MWHGGGGSNILTREEEGRKEIILSSQSGKGSAETQRVRHGRMSLIITDILTVDKETSIWNPGKSLDFNRDLIAQKRACEKSCV